ncbi:hypothetical protein RvY_12497 [Ramazzottius varieornatus]|uniref:Uncharacterized protein n=1 Tax=Ramazzottius varieornatus TaxID=947166 RepID=A0A1D1VNW5_RAMVA|nr:hypothetical protein RvY_12497 [Ramazzottius varieornatus]
MSRFLFAIQPHSITSGNNIQSLSDLPCYFHHYSQRRSGGTYAFGANGRACGRDVVSRLAVCSLSRHWTTEIRHKFLCLPAFHSGNLSGNGNIRVDLVGPIFILTRSRRLCSELD